MKNRSLFRMFFPIVILLALFLLFFHTLFPGTLTGPLSQSVAGTFAVADKTEDAGGCRLLLRLKPGLAEHQRYYSLRCTAEQYAAAEVGDLLDCAFRVNAVTLAGTLERVDGVREGAAA